MKVDFEWSFKNPIHKHVMDAISETKIFREGCVHTQIVKKVAQFGVFLLIPSYVEFSLVFNGIIFRKSYRSEFLARSVSNHLNRASGTW